MDRVTVGSLFISGQGGWASFDAASGASLSSLDGGSRLCTLRTAAGSRLAALPGAAGPPPPLVADAAARLGFTATCGGSLGSRGAVTRLGAVYTWGGGAEGQRGRFLAAPGGGDAPSLVPRLDGGVVSLSAGRGHFAAVTAEGFAYAWGSDERGQLGLAPTSGAGRHLQACGDLRTPGAPPREGAGEYTGVPRSVAALSHVPLAAVACGDDWTLFLSRAGDVYACGAGGCGQLGVGRVTCLLNPVRVPLEGLLGGGSAGEGGARVVALAAGGSHALALAASGEVLAWGLNASGQLGLGDFAARFTPAVVTETVAPPSLDGEGIGEAEDEGGAVAGAAARAAAAAQPTPLRASAIAAGAAHSAALCVDGRVLTWGAAEGGRLGHSFAAAPGAGGVDADAGAGGGGGGGAAARGGGAGAAAGAASRAAAAWPFATFGQGPLAAPPPGGAGAPPAPFEEPPHYARNAARPPRGGAVDTRDPLTGRPSLPAVEAGTWSLRFARSASHAAMREQGRAWERSAAEARVRASEGVAGAPGGDDAAAAAVGALLRPPPVDARESRGKPWLRSPVPRAGVPGVPTPTPVAHPLFKTRAVTRLACTADATLLFSPSCVESLAPCGGRERGGTRVTIAGPGLASVLRLPETALALALDGARDRAAAAAAYAAFAPVRHPATGLLPVAGVAVRFTLRTDDASSGVAPGAAAGGGSGSGARGGAFPVLTVPAYYPAGYDLSPFEAAAARVSAMGGDAAPPAAVTAVSPRPSSRGGGSRAGSASGRPRAPSAGGGSRPHSFRVRSDGTLYATSAAALERGLDVNADTLVCVSPGVPFPCRAEVAVVVATPEGGEVVLGGGALAFFYFTEPAIEAVAPRALCVPPGGAPPAGALRFTGAHLFGALLADAVARPAAEAMLGEVAALVAAREAEEAAAFAGAVAAGGGGAGGGGSGAIAARLAAAGALPALPPLAAGRTVGGADAPTDILAQFTVSRGGQAIATAEPVRAWVEMDYSVRGRESARPPSAARLKILPPPP